MKMFKTFYYLLYRKMYLSESEIITVCKPLSDDKHRFVRDNSKKCTGNPRQDSVSDKIQEFFF